MANTVSRGPHGVIRTVYDGAQDTRTIDDLVRMSIPFISADRAAGHSVRILADLTTCTHISASAWQTAGRVLRSLDFDQLAVVTKNTYFKHVASFIITATRTAARAKIFLTVTAAMTWLKGVPA